MFEVRCVLFLDLTFKHTLMPGNFYKFLEFSFPFLIEFFISEPFVVRSTGSVKVACSKLEPACSV